MVFVGKRVSRLLLVTFLGIAKSLVRIEIRDDGRSTVAVRAVKGRFPSIVLFSFSFCHVSWYCVCFRPIYFILIKMVVWMMQRSRSSPFSGIKCIMTKIGVPCPLSIVGDLPWIYRCLTINKLVHATESLFWCLICQFPMNHISCFEKCICDVYMFFGWTQWHWCGSDRNLVYWTFVIN